MPSLRVYCVSVAWLLVQTSGIASDTERLESGRNGLQRDEEDDCGEDSMSDGERDEV